MDGRHLNVWSRHNVATRQVAGEWNPSRGPAGKKSIKVQKFVKVLQGQLGKEES